MRIADTLAQIADPVFAHVDQYDAHALLTATIAFYGQICFDFAGYSSMAIGTARLIGYRFPPNFNYPYRAASATCRVESLVLGHVLSVTM